MSKKKTPIYDSSIGQKLLVGLTGLFLCLFLVVHFSGNTLLFRNDGGRAFEEYSHFMATNGAVRLLEIGLAAGFLGHILFSLRTWWHNRQSRPEGYRKNRPSENSALSSRVMIVTGSVIFAFLVVHLRSFLVPSRVTGTNLTMYELVVQAFRNPWYDLFYLVALGLLGYHLRHGFQSAWQTFGLRPGVLRVVEPLAVVFWLLLPLGYAAMPIYFFFSKS
jgi:succinate dehydrogenase / fumarate reductase, cytochrome b subunit